MADGMKGGSLAGRASRLLASLTGAGEARPAGLSGGGPAEAPIHVARDVSGEDVRVSPADLGRGVLVSGGTPAGSRNALMGVVEAVIARGGGCLVFDDTGASGFRDEVAALARRHAREDDLAWLDLGSDAVDTGVFNPLFAGSPEDFVGPLPGVWLDGEPVGGAMWYRRAAFLLTGVLRLMCRDRDLRGEPVGIDALRGALDLRAIVEAVEREPRGASHEGGEMLRSYLSSLPGFQPDKGARQAQTTLEQHGRLVMIVSSFLKDLDGRPALTGRATVDMADLVRGRRILGVSNRDAGDGAAGYVLASALHVLRLERMRAALVETEDRLPFLLAYSARDCTSRPLPVVMADRERQDDALVCGIASRLGTGPEPSREVVEGFARFGTKVDLGPAPEDGEIRAEAYGPSLPAGRPDPGAYPPEAFAPPLTREAWLGRYAPLSFPRPQRRAGIAAALETQLGAPGDSDGATRLLTAGLHAYAADIPIGGMPADAFLARLAGVMRLPEPGRSAALRGLADAVTAVPLGIPGAFASTRALAAFEAAREAGLGSGAFAWLRFHRRPMWFALNGYGRPEPWAEGLGILAHREAERAAGGPIGIPVVQPVEDALFDLSVGIEEGRR